MSKHPSDKSKRNLLRRGLAGILALALFLSLLPASVFTASAASWADPYVETLVDWGVMRGDISGNMAPDRSITRAEFVTMMNRAYGYTKLGGHPFTDVKVTDWFSDDIDIGYNIGYFKGTAPTVASPNATLTREQAAVLLARNMMLQPTVGETLGFSDSRTLSEWSRGLVGAAAANGIIGGYEDGTFQPFQNITRGEVAAMLVRAIGTPINTEGEHALGNVYGNVTVNTAGVTLRDGTIVGNLYLTGGIDLGDVLLENVTVLGEIIVSGGGESNSSESSVIMRNVTADSMTVDSISDQFVTIRAEGVTDIPTVTVRTNAYVDDSSLPGYGLSYIALDGDAGTLLQLAGKVKEVVNRTPDSSLQVVQGSADKITIDEKATGSTVLVDGDAQVGDLNLDVATTVTGTGDIKNLNVGAAGSTVAQLPDQITIRPGIVADIAGSSMNSNQATESSADPRILAGYPAVRKIAPDSAQLVFRVNKPGTIYWAISAVADGSVSEADLLEPPVYGGNILMSGTIRATEANKDFTASVSKLTRDGSYYVTAMLVDGRDQHSPIKVTSFSTPDDTVPAFNKPYPMMTRVTTENAQVTVMTNKSCLLYYALLPAGSTAPTPEEFKANAISGNLGYGTIDTIKNVTQPFQVNSTRLKELTDYTLYLWLTDYNGAKSSQVTALNFKTPDEQPPVIVSREQTGSNANSVEVTFSLNEAGTLYWAIVPEGMRDEMNFEGIDEEQWNAGEVSDPSDRRLQIKIENGSGAIKNGSKAVREGYVNGRVELNDTRPLDPAIHGTSSFTMYLVAKDAAGNYSKIQKINVKVKDTANPTVKQEFNPGNAEKPNEPPVNTDVRLVFSERVVGLSRSDDFLELYRKVKETENSPAEQVDAKNALASALYKYIRMYNGVTGDSTSNDRDEVAHVTACQYDPATNTTKYGSMVNGQFVEDTDWVINYCNAVVEEVDKEGNMTIVFPTDRENADKRNSALNMNSGSTYHFVVEDIVDTADDTPNGLDPDPTRLPEFTTQAARVLLEKNDTLVIKNADVDFNNAALFPGDHSLNDPKRIDYSFKMLPQDVEKADPGLYWDMLFWFSQNVSITVYSRPINADGDPINASTGGKYADPDDAPWSYEGKMFVPANGFNSWMTNIPNTTTNPTYDQVRNMLDLESNGHTLKEQREYAIHVDELERRTDYTGWNVGQMTMNVTVVAGARNDLKSNLNLVNGGDENTYKAALANGVLSIESPVNFELTRGFFDQNEPTISTVPTIEVGYSTANIKVFLNNRRGQVYYIAIPLSDLYDKDGVPMDPKVELKEDMVNEVSSYYPAMSLGLDEAGRNPPKLSTIPLMVGDSDRVGYTDEDHTKNGLEVMKPNIGDFGTSDLDRVKRGVTPVSASDSLPHEIKLTSLEANTVYVLVLAPIGVSSKLNPNTQILAYRFTTNMEDIPKIELSGTRNPTIVATETTNTPAIIDYALVNFDVVNSLLDRPFKEVVDDDEVFAKYTPESDALKEWLKVAGNTKDKISVRQAMADQQHSGTTFIGTAFDLYAKEENKNDYVTLVRSLSSGGSGSSDSDVLVGVRGDKAVTSLTMNFGNDIGDRKDGYILIAMARRSQSSEHFSFSAWYIVQTSPTSPPVINSGWFDSFTFTEGEKSSISAKFTLEFDKEIYKYMGSGSYIPCDTCGLHTATSGTTGSSPVLENGHYALGTGVSTSSSAIKYAGNTDSTHSDTRTISIEVTGLSASNGYETISFPGLNIVAKNGTTVDRGTLIITVEAQSIGTAENPEYELKVTLGNPKWSEARWTGLVRTVKGTPVPPPAPPEDTTGGNSGGTTQSYVNPIKPGANP